MNNPYDRLAEFDAAIVAADNAANAIAELAYKQAYDNSVFDNVTTTE